MITRKSCSIVQNFGLAISYNSDTVEVYKGEYDGEDNVNGGYRERKLLIRNLPRIRIRSNKNEEFF